MSGSVNKVILVGNVGKDVEVHYFDDRSLVARFPLATSEVYKNRNGERVERTEWHNIVARNQIAELFQKYLKKGDKIYIEGRIRSRDFVDRDGNKRYITEIFVRDFTFLSSKPASTMDNPVREKTGTDVQPENTGTNPLADNPSSPDGNSEDDDLPF
jgi:single-strand DNA-binding protein